MTILSKSWNLGRLLRDAGVMTLTDDVPASLEITGLADSSKDVTPGCCFVAVAGSKANGATYLSEAIRAGAGSVVVTEGTRIPPGVMAVRVADTREALSRMAAAFCGLHTNPLRLVGITGTNGKTTVAWILRSILASAGRRTALLGTIEHDLLAHTLPASLTTPGSLELCGHLQTALNAGAEFAVMEVSSHALHQRRCDGLHFEAGVFTNLSGDHLDYHGSMADYRNAKRRLFELLSAKGTAVVNGDDRASTAMVRNCPARVVRFGLGAGRDVSAVEISLDCTGTKFEMLLHGQRLPIRTSLIGEHNVGNILAAAGAAHALGVAADDIAAGVRDLRVVPGRLERVEPSGWPFSVFVDYAHTDDALSRALATLRPLTRRKLICVFGCGGDRDRTKRPRMGAVVSRLADVAVVTSDNPRTEDSQRIIDDILPDMKRASGCAVRVEADRRRAISSALGEARDGDTVLIAGKGHETYQIVGTEVRPFDDRAAARSVLRERALKSEDAA